MSRTSRIFRLGPVVFSASLFLAQLSDAANHSPRSWSNRKGNSITATYVRHDETQVWVEVQGKERALPKADLSDADLVWLASIPAAETTTPLPQAGGGGIGFHEAKIDPAAFTPVPGGFKLEHVAFPVTVQTKHFNVVGSEKIKPALAAAYAEVAERLMSDLMRDFPSIGKVFESNRFLILLMHNEAEAKMFNSWHSKHADASKSYVPHNPRLELSRIAGVGFDKALADELGIVTEARVFMTGAKGMDNLKKTWPERIHFLTSDIFRQAFSKVRSRSDYNTVLLQMSLAYEREYSLCGKIETEVKFTSSASDVESFKNGKAWAAATKKLIKNGAKPDIDAFLKVEASEAPPRDLGFGFGLIQFIRKDAARTKGFDEFCASLIEGEEPDPRKFATALGYATPEELGAAWLQYMESDAFQ